MKQPRRNKKGTTLSQDKKKGKSRAKNLTQVNCLEYRKKAIKIIESLFEQIEIRDEIISKQAEIIRSNQKIRDIETEWVTAKIEQLVKTGDMLADGRERYLTALKRKGAKNANAKRTTTKDELISKIELFIRDNQNHNLKGKSPENYLKDALKLERGTRTIRNYSAESAIIKAFLEKR